MAHCFSIRETFVCDGDRLKQCPEVSDLYGHAREYIHYTYIIHTLPIISNLENACAYISHGFLHIVMALRMDNISSFSCLSHTHLPV